MDVPKRHSLTSAARQIIAAAFALNVSTYAVGQPDELPSRIAKVIVAGRTLYGVAPKTQPSGPRGRWYALDLRCLDLDTLSSVDRLPIDECSLKEPAALAWDILSGRLFFISQPPVAVPSPAHDLFRVQLRDLKRLTSNNPLASVTPLSDPWLWDPYGAMGGVRSYDLIATEEKGVCVYVLTGSGTVCTYTLDENSRRWNKATARFSTGSRLLRVAEQRGETYFCSPEAVFRAAITGDGQGSMTEVDDLRTELLIVNKDSGWNYCYADGEVRVLAHPEIKAKVTPPPPRDGQDEHARKDAELLRIFKTALALPKPQVEQPAMPTRRLTIGIVIAGATVIGAVLLLILRRRKTKAA